MRQAACKRPCMAFRMKSRASKKKTEVGCVRALLPFFPCPSPLLTLLAEPGLQSSSTNSCCFMLTQRGRLMHSSKKPVRTCQATVINTHTRTRIHMHTHTHTLAHKHTYTPSFFPLKKGAQLEEKVRGLEQQLQQSSMQAEAAEVRCQQVREENQYLKRQHKALQDQAVRLKQALDHRDAELAQLRHRTHVQQATLSKSHLDTLDRMGGATLRPGRRRARRMSSSSSSGGGQGAVLLLSVGQGRRVLNLRKGKHRQSVCV